MGSSLAVHDCSSLRFGAASACEFEEVNSVKVNGLFRWWVNIITRMRERTVLTPRSDSISGLFSILTPSKPITVTSSISLECL